MMGIRIEGHPNLIRILMDDDWEGTPCARTTRSAASRSASRARSKQWPSPPSAPDLRGLPHPFADPDRSSRSRPELRDSEDILEVNFGPNHPSTHGVLRLIVELHGERRRRPRARWSATSTPASRRTWSRRRWWKAITYPERIDYLSFQNNELVFVLAIEKLLGLEVPPKATWMRMCLAELNRIHSHLVWLATAALELGRDLDVLVLLPRARPDPRPVRDGHRGAHAHALLPGRAASPRTSRRGFFPEARKFVDWMPKAVDEYEALVDRNAIWLERTKGLGLLSADDAIALGQSGPVLRGSGVDWDLRKTQPYLAYDEVDFDVPVYENGDVWDRYKVHMDEMRESTRIVAQCLDRLEEMEGEPWIADDRKVVLPPREELHTSMESLIHHFKIVTEGYRVPEGEVYVRRRVAARRARLLRRLRRRAEAVAGEVPRAVLRRARGDRDLHERTRSSPT